MTIGASLVTYDCLSQDYCLDACIKSALAVVDQMAICDNASKDNTWNYLNDRYGSDKRIKLKQVDEPKYTGHRGWQTGENWVARCANHARELLQTDWHLLMQADEVLHEDDTVMLRDHVTTKTNASLILLEFWRDHRQILPIKASARLGKRIIPVIADGGTLDYHTTGVWHNSSVRLYHYGYIRNFEQWRRKAMFLQMSLHNDFDPTWAGGAQAMYATKATLPFKTSHPAAIHAWLLDHHFEP